MIGNVSNNLFVNGFLILLTIFAYLPLNFVHGLVLKPNLLLLSVFYFSIFTDTRPSIIFLIILGLFDDLLNNTFVGITPLIYFLTSLFASSNQKALSHQRFYIVWLSLIIVVIVMNFLEALVLTKYYSIGLMNPELFIVIALSSLVYPALHFGYSIWINLYRARHA